jgi:hypothetical protein
LPKAITHVESAELELHSHLGPKVKTPGEKKPFLEQNVGDSFWRKGRRWMHVDQIIDRGRNRYTKKVTDPETGEALRDVDEPLTDHRGYGSPKKK